MRFLDLTLADDVPDSRTVWNFREQITDLGLVEKLFDQLLKELSTLGLVINEGKIIDASFVEAPHQHNKSAENEKIK
jgi:transposase